MGRVCRGEPRGFLCRRRCVGLERDTSTGKPGLNLIKQQPSWNCALFNFEQTELNYSLLSGQGSLRGKGLIFRVEVRTGALIQCIGGASSIIEQILLPGASTLISFAASSRVFLACLERTKFMVPFPKK